MTLDPSRAKEDGPPPAALAAIPTGLGTVWFGAAGVTLFGAAVLVVLRRAHDPTLHAPVPLIAALFLLGVLWLVASAGLLRRAPWARWLVVAVSALELVVTGAFSLALELSGLAGPPLHRLGPACLGVLLAHPAFGRVLRGADAPAGGRAYVSAVGWGTVLFLALGLAPTLSTLARSAGAEPLAGAVFDAARLLRSPVLAPLVLPLLVLVPLPLAGVDARAARVAVHVVGAGLALPVIAALFEAALSIGR